MLTIRVCGADRAQLLDPFDLELVTVPGRVSLVSAAGRVGAFDIDGLSPTQTYQATVTPRHHRPVSAFFLGTETDLTLFAPVTPAAVTSIEWPPVYPEALVRVISVAEIAALTDLQRAGLLNLYAKLIAADLWTFMLRVTEVRGDRIFAVVAEDVWAYLEPNNDWVSVDGSLHTPPDGFVHAGSYKQRGVTAGVLQVTLFTDGRDYRADLDIDDAGGFAHVFQVLDHAVTGSATHPYDIHQLLTFHQGLDPGYRLVV